MLMCVLLFPFAHETAGAARTRSSLRPSWDRTAPSFFWGRMNLQNSGEYCREIVDLRPHTTSPQSSSAKADDPVFRDARDGIENSRHTGYSAFAEYDGGEWSVVINCIDETCVVPAQGRDDDHPTPSPTHSPPPALPAPAPSSSARDCRHAPAVLRRGRRGSRPARCRARLAARRLLLS